MRLISLHSGMLTLAGVLLLKGGRAVPATPGQRDWPPPCSSYVCWAGSAEQLLQVSLWRRRRRANTAR